MKNLYRLQTLLVVFFLSMIPSWTFAQFADPHHVYVKNSGASYTDQFAAFTGYTWAILQGINTPLGAVNFEPGGSTNTLKLTFYPTIGAVGTADVIVSYYTLTTPMHPVTRWYKFHVSPEVVIAGRDQYVVDKNAVDVVFEVLNNDSLSNGTLKLSSVSVSSAGTATVNGTGDAILFTPNADFEGDTWLQYIACDSLGNCGEGNVHVLVRDAAVQDHLGYNKYILNTEVLELLAPFENFEVEDAPSHGVLASNGAYGWVFTPEEGYVGKDTFKINLQSEVSRTYYITVYQKSTNVHARNDRFYVRPGLSVTFNVLNNDLLDYSVGSHTNPTKGTLNEISNGLYTYSPYTGYRGIDKFTYTTCFEDSVYCETATVLIHVTDLEPDNVFTYNLQTSVDLPLAIDYPIEYTDFFYIITTEPTHGDLIFHQGLQQVEFPCDTVDGYNLLTYVPEPGYIGPDSFDYYYCIDPSNQCFQVKAAINVVEEPEEETCPCVIGCVWPGDADQNGRVDMGDLLTLGNQLGESGAPRDYSSPETWFGQHATNWSSNGGSVEFIDGNGDGTITDQDVNLISDYYYQTHDVVAKDVQQKLPFQFSIIPVQYSLDSGDVVILDIAFGTANNPVLDLKGAKFSINLPPGMVDSSSLIVDFHEDSWLAEGAPYISLGKMPWDGRIDAGFARAQGNGATGYGVIATVVFIIVDDIEGFKSGKKIRIPVTITGGSGMDNEGVIYDVDGDEFILEFDLNSSNKPQYTVVVYPNPANDLVDLHINGRTEINNIIIGDMQGRPVHQISDVNSKHHQIDISTLPVGLYYVQVNHSAGTITQLLSVIR